jgi:hypothetical protein
MTDPTIRDEHDRASTDHLLARLDHMVAAGRVTPDEAARVRAANSEHERAAALRSIRERHATERVRTAVDEGRLEPAEADDIVQRLRAGEDAHHLRRRILASKNEPAPSDDERDAQR